MVKGYRLAALAVVFAAAVALAIAWAIHRPAPKPAEPLESASGRAGDVLIVDPARAAQMGLLVQGVEPAGEIPLAAIPAVIQPPVNARVAVTPMAAGVVERVLVIEGDAVRRGQPLALVASREVLSVAADLAGAQARLKVAEANAARLSTLAEEGVIAAARADEAEAAAAEARAVASERSRLLRMINGRGSSGAYTLTAPIAGRVTHAGVEAGVAVDASAAAFIIDAADRYEVVGQAPERLVGQIRTGMAVRLPPDVTGRVIAVGSTLDPQTRSALVKAEIPAGPGVMAGRATTILVWGAAPAGAVVVPENAVTEIDGRSVVFVAAQGGYAVRPVSRGGASDGKAILLSGLKPGERVVTMGTSALKALALAR